jgi:hypothetical protein
MSERDGEVGSPGRCTSLSVEIAPKPMSFPATPPCRQVSLYQRSWTRSAQISTSMFASLPTVPKTVGKRASKKLSRRERDAREDAVCRVMVDGQMICSGLLVEFFGRTAILTGVFGTAPRHALDMLLLGLLVCACHIVGAGQEAFLQDFIQAR